MTGIQRAPASTRAAAPNNLAAFMQYIPLLGSVEDGIVQAFRNGGGVPYEDFPRFHEVMADDSGQSVVPALLDHIRPLVPGLVSALHEAVRGLGPLHARPRGPSCSLRLAGSGPPGSLQGCPAIRSPPTIERQSRQSSRGRAVPIADASYGHPTLAASVSGSHAPW